MHPVREDELLKGGEQTRSSPRYGSGIKMQHTLRAGSLIQSKEYKNCRRNSPIRFETEIDGENEEIKRSFALILCLFSTIETSC